MEVAVGIDMGRELHAWSERLQAIADDHQFLSTWQTTLDWLADDQVSRALADYLARSPKGQWDAVLAPFQRRYLTLSELQVAHQLEMDRPIAGATVRDVLTSSFAKAAYDRVAEALELVDFNIHRRFVMIGCGPFPAAVLLIHDRTSLPEIVGVDYSTIAVGSATTWVQRFATPRVSIVQGDGKLFDFREADVIYVANHVVGKLDVLHRIADTAAAGTKILLREPVGLGRLLSEKVADVVPAEFHVRRRGEPNHEFYSMHVLIDLQPRSG